MAIAIMQRVWDKSQATGTDLLVLLALADRADEDGLAWPGVAYLARKARIKERTAQYCLRRLLARGEIYIQAGGGRKHTNMYLIRVGTTAEEARITLEERLDYQPEEALEAIPEQAEEKVQDNAPLEKGAKPRTKGAKPRTKGAKPRQEKVQGVAPDPLINPSVNPLKESLRGNGGAGAPPPPKPKEPAPPSPAQQALKEMVIALAEACCMDPALNYSRLARDAKALITAHYAPEQVRAVYRKPGGAWYATDWRGKKGEAPDPGTVRATIGALTKRRAVVPAEQRAADAEQIARELGLL